MCDLEQVGGDRADLFWMGVSMASSLIVYAWRERVAYEGKS